MKSLKPLVLPALALLLTCSGAQAQTVYRCGNSYSQSPCADARALFHFYNISEVKSDPMIHGHDTMDSTVVALSSMDLRASARWSSSASRLLNTRL